MKKTTLLLGALTGFLCLFGHNDQTLGIQLISSTEPTINGTLEVILTYTAKEDLKLQSGLVSELPQGWRVSNWGSLSQTSLAKGEVVKRRIQLSYPISDLPFYPQSFSFSYLTNSPSGELVEAAGRVYFTPWNQVEIWSYFDFVHLDRNWLIPVGEDPERIFVDPGSIPVSNIPAGYVAEEPWQEEFQEVFVPGLAYSIPMLARHPDSIANDTANIILSSSGYRYDGCGGTWRRYKGTFTGTVLASFGYDLGTDIDTLLPLGGLQVEVWESDAMYSTRLGKGTTAKDGSFSIAVNTCQLGEGGELEVFLKVKAKNEQHNIRGKNTWVLGRIQRAETSLMDWDYNDGDRQDYDFGTIEVDNGAHRSVAMAVQSWEYFEAYSSRSLDDPLTVRADLSSTGSFFLPDKYRKVPITLPANAVWLVPKLGLLLGPIATTYFISDLLLNTQKPTIFLTESASRRENTPRHEFGHFAQWSLQNTGWTEPLSGSFASHHVHLESNTRIAFSEGWANAFSMMIDAHFHDWDGESGYSGGGYNYEKRSPLEIDFGPASEYYIGCAFFDLWDGRDKYRHLQNPNLPHQDLNSFASSNGYLFGETDEVSLSFRELCDVIAEGDDLAAGGVIGSIQGFYKSLIRDKSCEERKQIKRIFDQNRVVGVVDSFPTSLDFRGFSSDEIIAIQSINYSGNTQGIPWSYDFVHEYDRTSLSGSGQDYNLASRDVNGYKFLSDDLIVKDGATLSFNKNLPLGWVSSNDPVRPARNSTLQAELCGNMKLKAIQGGNVVVGDQAVTAHADLRLKAGSSLRLGGGSPSNSGTLLVNDHSRLYVEEGAELIIDQGAHIHLGGEEAVLEIDGDLTLLPGATFTFSGKGHLVFGNPFWNATVTADSTAKIHLQGSDPNDLILRIKDHCHLWTDVPCKRFDIEEGRIEMGTDANIMLNAQGFRLRNAVITNSGTGLHSGIITAGQADHLIEKVHFSRGKYGLRAYQIWGSGRTIALNHCQFSDCEVGLKVHHGAAKLTQCDFNHNTTGYQHELAAFNSRLSHCTFNQGSNGILYRTASGDLHFNKCDASHNSHLGVFLNGPGTLTGKCSAIRENGNYGVVIANGASLDLSDNVDAAGSQFKVTDNQDLNIYAYQAGGINLFHGANDLVPAIPNANRILQGTVLGPCQGGTTAYLDAESNHWNNRSASPQGDPPTWGTDYWLYQSTQAPTPFCLAALVLTDPIRHKPSPLCSHGQTGGNGSGNTSSGTGGMGSGITAKRNPLRNCLSCRTINSPTYPNVSLNRAVQAARAEMEAYSPTNQGNNRLALAHFHEILSQNLPNLNPEEAYVVKAAILLSKKAFNDATAQGAISLDNYHQPAMRDPAINQLHHILNIKAKLTKTPAQQEVVKLEQSMIDRIAQQHTTVQSDLITLQANTPSALEDWIAYTACYLNLEKQLQAGHLNPDQFEAHLQTCQAASKSKTVFEVRSQLGPNLASPTQPSLLLATLSPNPATNHCLLRVTGAESGHIALYSVDGKQHPLHQHPSPAIGNSFQVALETSTLKKGIYFLQIHTPTGTRVEKLAIQ